LENILESLKQRSGIQLDLATVESTGGQDIFDFSRQLASDWGVGARGATTKRLLVVISVNEKAMFTQFSKSAQGALPETILGEMGQRIRAFIGSGQFAQGLSNGVRYFVNAMGLKMGFSLEEIERTQTAASPAPEPIAVKATVEAGPALAVPTVGSVTERRKPTSRNPKHRDAAPGRRMVASQKATTPCQQCS